MSTTGTDEPAPGSRLALVAGISSHLGALVAEELLAAGYRVIGTYRTPGADLERVAAAQGPAGPPALYRVDVCSWGEVERFLEATLRPELARASEAAFVYCCGLWHYGPAEELDADTFDRVVGVGLRAPCLMSAWLLRSAPCPVHVVLVTGLGGEKAAAARLGLYSLCTNGIYTFVRATGMELAGGPSSCTGVALGLFEKSQSRLRERCARLNIRRPGDMHVPARFIRQCAVTREFHLNGAVVELADGLFNYQGIVELAMQDRAKAAEP